MVFRLRAGDATRCPLITIHLPDTLYVGWLSYGMSSIETQLAVH